MALRKLRDFPEVQSAERAAIIDPSISAGEAANRHPVLLSTGKALFGVGADEVQAWLFEPQDALEIREQDEGIVPTIGEAEDAYEEYRSRFMRLYAEDEPEEFDDLTSHDDFVLAKYALHGWDAANEQGQVLLVAQNLLFPFLAAVHGCAGAKLPEEGVETLAAWTAKLSAPPSRSKAATRSPVPVPISEDERRRRNLEAKRSTVWRPEPRK